VAHPNLNTTDAAKNLAGDPEPTEASGPPAPARTEPETPRFSQRPGLESEMTSPIPTYDTDRYRLVRPFTTRL